MLSTRTQDWFDLQINPNKTSASAERPQPVGVIEYFLDLQTLGRLSEADHFVWTADFDEGEAGFGGKLGCQGGLARIGCTLGNIIIALMIRINKLLPP